MNAADEQRLRAIESRQHNYLKHMVTLGSQDIPWLVEMVREQARESERLRPKETEDGSPWENQFGNKAPIGTR